jgi:glycosyltransferase involved in cell wall biosynthesis
MAAGMSEERVYAVPNCIDPSPFLDDDDRQAARADLGLADEEVAVGTMAHFTPRKAHSDLLEAAALVAPQAPHVRWLWAGEGPLEARMRARARGLGLADRVCFLGYRSDAPRLHRAFDILALPSLAEGLPLVVLEAMASARPCVVTNVSGNPEIVADGATGLLVPPRCPSAMGEALLALARDPDLRARMGEAGRRRVLERFTMERMVELMRDVMDREIARQSM